MNYLFRAKSAFASNDFLKYLVVRSRKKQLKAFLRSNQRINFPHVASPKASIVVLGYNHAYHTLQCLLSLLDFLDESIEVVFFNNGSTDETSELVGRFENLRIVDAHSNVGFIRGMNSAIFGARGEYVLLMNNDARMLDGSLQEIFEAFESDPSVGYMGARIVHANGGLQEAGGMIFQDGKTNCYLRYQKPGDPRALFQREVDFCSAVVAVVEKKQFLAMGGFDEFYAPAYYDETDFCMRLRRIGKRCVYNPKILVEHFEFGTGGSSKKARAQIERNRAKFLSRWQHVLSDEGYAAVQTAAVEEFSAKRLLTNPRRLLIFAVQEFDADVVESEAKKLGTVSVLLRGKLQSELVKYIQMLDYKIEFYSTSTEYQFRSFLRRNKDRFHEIREIGVSVSRGGI